MTVFPSACDIGTDHFGKSCTFWQVLQNPEVSRRLTKWTIELGEFDIKFMPRTAVKGQAVANFVAEFTYLTKALGMTTSAPSTPEGCIKDDEPTDPSNV